MKLIMKLLCKILLNELREAFNVADVAANSSRSSEASLSLWPRPFRGKNSNTNSNSNNKK